MLDIFSRVHVAASQAQGHEATEKQADAGNYRKGAVDIRDLKVVIEQARNTYRTGTDKNGTQWATRLAADYGYFAGTTGADGDGVDCFVGSFPEAEHVYVINQRINGLFDEHKVMLGFLSLDDAKNAYEYSYDKGWQGLHQIIPCTFVQFKWWLKFGNKTKPITLESLPFDSESENTMNDTFNWNTTDQNETASKAIYEMRRTDDGEELLEAATLDSVMDSVIEEGGEIEEEAVMDALVIKHNQLERKAKLLGAIFNRAGGEVKVAENGVVITKPFKQMGSTQVAIMFEMTDGQTITVFLHNPDLKPNQLQSDDALISWKWLLNRKDITIVVAKENGKDLVPQVAATRVMALVNKNSARFTKANAKRAERLVGIANLEKEVTDKTEVLNALVKEIEVLEAEQNQPTPTGKEEPQKEKTPPVAMPEPILEPVQEGVAAVVDPVSSEEAEPPTEPETPASPEASNTPSNVEPEAKEKHYSDVIFECLEKLGWKLTANDGGSLLYSSASKSYAGVQVGGEVDPNGDIVISAQFDERARYLSAYSGFDQLFDMDGRDQEPESFAKRFDECVSEFTEKMKQENHVAPAISSEPENTKPGDEGLEESQPSTPGTDPEPEPEVAPVITLEAQPEPARDTPSVDIPEPAPMAVEAPEINSEILNSIPATVKDGQLEPTVPEPELSLRDRSNSQLLSTLEAIVAGDHDSKGESFEGLKSLLELIELNHQQILDSKEEKDFDMVERVANQAVIKWATLADKFKNGATHE